MKYKCKSLVFENRKLTYQKAYKYLVCRHDE
jgi:hypothetical protein